MMSSNTTNSCVFGPSQSKDGKLQISAHSCGKHFQNELKLIFPTIDLTNLIAIITCQKAVHDLSNFDIDVDIEKDELLEKVRIRLIIQLRNWKLLISGLIPVMISNGVIVPSPYSLDKVLGLMANDCAIPSAADPQC